MIEISLLTTVELLGRCSNAALKVYIKETHFYQSAVYKSIAGCCIQIPLVLAALLKAWIP